MPVTHTLALLGIAASPPLLRPTPLESDAGNRLVPLVAPAGPRRRACTADALWCVSLAEPEDEGAETMPIVRSGAAPRAAPEAVAEPDGSNETNEVWPNLVLLQDGGFLAGVETRIGTAYSGGGGSATELRLFRIAPDGAVAARPVLRVPLQASLMIRACFSERDMKLRRNACHDEYRFSATLTPARETAGGLPGFAYVTDARAFPRGASRSGDSTERPRLTRADLVHARDPHCSYTRRFRFDAGIGRYEPEVPLPDCALYTEP